MSIIIYGPQGCGKTRHAEALRRFFKMDEVCDDEMDPYPLTLVQQAEFKAGKVLFLTNIEPRSKDYDTRYGDYDNRRVYSFEQAMKAMRNKA